MSLESKLRGYLWGSACGDALGMPVEFLPYSEIIKQYGEKGIQDLAFKSPWTDDTQMMLAIAKALIRGSDKPLNELMEIVTEEYIEWMADPGIAPGNTCMAGVTRLRDGIHWTKSGIADSKGCGSVMRSGIIGFVYQNDIDKLKKVASASGIATHGHPAANAACIAGALAIKYALDGFEPKEMFEPIMEETKGISAEFEKIMYKARELAESDYDTQNAIIQLGEGWVGDEAFAISYYVAMKHPNNYTKVVRLAVNITGDSDSIGCISGGILGARLGISAVPNTWINNLEGTSQLELMVRPLLNLSVR